MLKWRSPVWMLVCPWPRWCATLEWRASARRLRVNQPPMVAATIVPPMAAMAIHWSAVGMGVARFGFRRLIPPRGGRPP